MSSYSNKMTFQIPKNISSLAKESSHTMSEMLVADQIQSEISRTNAFTFSNVSCLNNNPTTIDYQFSKLMAFVQSTSTDADLEKLLAPLLCHLFIEMTKGKDWKMASIFLRKYSQAISPVRLNNGHEDHELPAEILSDHKHSFGELIQTLSNVSKKQDIDSIPSIVDFRSCKYKVKLSFTGLALLKQFLARHGHILILQLLSTRFDIEVYSERKEEMEDDGPAPVNLFIKKEPNGLGEGSKEVLVNGFQMSPKVEVKIEDVKVERDEQFYRDGLEEVVNRFRNFNLPINIHVLENVPNISSVSIDKSGCHIAGGFEESHLTIWSVNQFSKQYNGIPHNDLVHPWSNRVACEWHFNRSVEEMNLDDGVPVEMEANTKNVILRGHSKAVTSVLYSVFNPVLLSTSRDCTIRLWTDVNYRCASVLRGHNHPIWCLAESSNGYNLATGSKDTTARLWATDREFPLQVYAGHKQDIDVNMELFFEFKFLLNLSFRLSTSIRMETTWRQLRTILRFGCGVLRQGNYSGCSLTANCRPKASSSAQTAAFWRLPVTKLRSGYSTWPPVSS